MIIGYGNLLILSFLFLTALNCLVTYLCSSSSLKVANKTKSLSKGIARIKRFDQYILNNLLIVTGAVYVLLSYLFLSSVIVASDYFLALSLAIGFIFVLLTTFFSRLCYCYACNVLLKTKLNEYDVFIENLFYLLRMFFPLFTIAFVVPTLNLLPFKEITRQILSISFISLYFIVWSLIVPVKNVIVLNAKVMPKNDMYFTIADIFQRNEIKRYKIYYWDSSKTNEANAIVSGSYFHYLFISTTLMEILDKRELEAAILHEIGHIKNHHFTKIFISKTLLLLAISILLYCLTAFAKINIFVTVGLVLAFFVIMGFNLKGVRKYEDEADLFVNQKGFGKELISALKKVSYEEESLSKLDEFFSSHPDVEKRIDHLNK